MVGDSIPLERRVEVDAFGETASQFGETERSDPGGRQLDRQWYAGESTADRADGGLVRHVARGVGLHCPGDEQLLCRTVDRQRWYAHRLLTADAQRLAAGHQHRHP